MPNVDRVACFNRASAEIDGERSRNTPVKGLSSRRFFMTVEFMANNSVARGSTSEVRIGYIFTGYGAPFFSGTIPGFCRSANHSRSAILVSSATVGATNSIVFCRF